MTESIQKWQDFLMLSVLLFIVSTLLVFFFPVLNLWIAPGVLGVFCLVIVCIGCSRGDTVG